MIGWGVVYVKVIIVDARCINCPHAWHDGIVWIRVNCSVKGIHYSPKTVHDLANSNSTIVVESEHSVYDGLFQVRQRPRGSHPTSRVGLLGVGDADVEFHSCAVSRRMTTDSAASQARSVKEDSLRIRIIRSGQRSQDPRGHPVFVNVLVIVNLQLRKRQHDPARSISRIDKTVNGCARCDLAILTCCGSIKQANRPLCKRAKVPSHW